MKKLWISITCALLITVIALPALAEGDDYYVTGSVVAIGGGERASENFIVQDLVGLMAIGGSESEEYHIESGSAEHNPLNNPPIADAGGPYLLAVGETIRLTGTGQDSDGDILDYYPWVQKPSLGTLDYDQGLENPTYTAGSMAGIAKLTFTVSDGILEDANTTIVVIYDPSAGFVTGGGWIDSPSGAYTPDDPEDIDFTGKATFGFVSKYKKGATVPIGQTEFQFRAGDLSFHSSSYKWLVVTGSGYAKFRGDGNINGIGDYKFMLWAGDGEPDTFRIKIWTEDGDGTETVIYDNGFDQEIEGGSIVVHTSKK